MEKASLTISLPRMMKDFIEAKLREGRFSTPSEYIRSLIRDDQDLTGNSGVALMIRRGDWAGKTGKASEEPGAARTASRARKIE
jgi:antitoxin ParD1/3/4